MPTQDLDEESRDLSDESARWVGAGMAVAGLIALASVGLGVVLWLGLSSSEAGIRGDLLAGTVGVGGGLASAVLFFSALMVQREDLKIARSELRLQRKELEAARKAQQGQQKALEAQRELLELELRESTARGGVPIVVEIRRSAS